MLPETPYAHEQEPAVERDPSAIGLAITQALNGEQIASVRHFAEDRSSETYNPQSTAI
jgi:hypothetical protein